MLGEGVCVVKVATKCIKKNQKAKQLGGMCILVFRTLQTSIKLLAADFNTEKWTLGGSSV